jgi:hypothetical protein
MKKLISYVFWAIRFKLTKVKSGFLIHIEL